MREGIEAAISIRIQEPVFESQTKTKLGSQATAPDGPSLRNWINDFIKKELDNYLHKNPAIADTWLKKIQQSEKERKEIAGIKSWLMKELRRRICIIKNYVIAGLILIVNMPNEWTQPCLLLKEIQQAGVLPLPVMSILRQYFHSEVSH